MKSSLTNRVLDFLRDEDGPTATEYAAMFAVILLGAIVGIAAVGTKVNAHFVEARNGW